MQWYSVFILLFLHFLSIQTIIRTTKSTHRNVVLHIINSFQDDSGRRCRFAGHCHETKRKYTEKKLSINRETEI
ncbi:hypothetical protein ES319_D08G124100v1 [Gossypium barbadense]|uniref:Secreted protein n=2 Tax=Gossypium TaxID=3633 RepID=A0A5J5QJA0_GOSBA|nr:hypothetical protein ES319_D08G124100v1 [Gossypium barbadense]TYG57308.1 hypothetical protein ES288_D08G131800v1 [Gossypium darwinii]